MSAEPASLVEPVGFHAVRSFPVAGDTAVAEIWRGEDLVADVRLEGVQIGRTGAGRVVDAACVVRFHLPPAETGGGLPFDLAEVETELKRARRWLMDNEQRRAAVASTAVLTPAQAALNKIGLDEAQPVGQMPKRRPSGLTVDASAVIGSGKSDASASEELLWWLTLAINRLHVVSLSMSSVAVHEAASVSMAREQGRALLCQAVDDVERALHLLDAGARSEP